MERQSEFTYHHLLERQGIPSGDKTETVLDHKQTIPDYQSN
jgi:hypothetical protein